MKRWWLLLSLQRNNMHVSRPDIDAPLLPLSPGHAAGDLSVSRSTLWWASYVVWGFLGLRHGHQNGT